MKTNKHKMYTAFCGFYTPDFSFQKLKTQNDSARNQLEQYEIHRRNKTKLLNQNENKDVQLKPGSPLVAAETNPNREFWNVSTWRLGFFST